MRTECEVCGETADNHEGKAHPFIAPGQSLPTREESKRAQAEAMRPSIPTAPQAAMPVDLALRAALLQAGIITPAQLEAADERVKQGGVIVVVPDPR